MIIKNAAFHERYPHLLYLDYETYSVVSPKTHGAYVYSRHQSTEVLCFAYALDNGPVGIWYPGQPVPEDFVKAWADPDYGVVAFNVMFELCITTNVLRPRTLGWQDLPRIPVTRWVDASAVARMASLGGPLEKVPTKLNLKHAKHPDFAMKRLSKPRKPTKNNPATRFTPENAPEEFADLYRYCQGDVVVTRELLQTLLTMIPIPRCEMNYWAMDLRMNLRGLPVDVPAAHHAYKLTQQYLERKQVHAMGINGLKFTQRDKNLAWLRKRGVRIENWSQDHITHVIKTVKDPKARELLEIRLQTAKTSTAKLARLAHLSLDRRSRGMLLLYGADATGRYAGRLLQPQNFPRGTEDREHLERVFTLLRAGVTLEELEYWLEQPMDDIAKALRGFIMAPPGQNLYVGDYAAIEFRAACWLAGQEDALERIREFDRTGDPNLEEYRIMAAVIYQKAVEKINKHPERWVGKQTVLGCIYMMGEARYAAQCEGYGVVVPQPTIARAIKAFRHEMYPKIRTYWRGITNHCCRAVQEAKAAREGGSSRTTVLRDRLVFRAYKRNGHVHLMMRLPSGRVSFYPYASTVKGKYGGRNLQFMTDRVGMGPDARVLSTMVKRTIHGGTLTENASSGLSRDVMMHGMFHAEKQGFAPVSTVHDEVVSEVKVLNGTPPTLDKYLDAITPDVPWAPGLPMKAAGFCEPRWRKD